MLLVGLTSELNSPYYTEFPTHVKPSLVETVTKIVNFVLSKTIYLIKLKSKLFLFFIVLWISTYKNNF